jgi:GT2 family glycosyltransferase
VESSPVDRCVRGRVGAADASIAVVVLTHSRVHLLAKCVENVLNRMSTATREIVIWNNGSTDGTAAYLDALDDDRLIVVHNEANIGQNAYAKAFEMTSSGYLVELDDDVVNAPPNWDMTLLDAYRRLPTIGFLAADLEDDPHDVASHYRYRIRPHLYTETEVNGVRLLEGPAGGACAMTSRDLYRRVGGFRQHRRFVFWQEEPAYIADINRLGYGSAVLAELKVHHTGGVHYGVSSPEKIAFWVAHRKRRVRRQAIKKIVFSLPFFRRFNARFGWFTPPP